MSDTENKKVFIDTSVIIAAILSESGGSFYILTQFHKDYKFLINKFVLDEVEEVVDKKFDGSSEMYENLFLLMSIASIKVLPNPPKKKLDELNNVISKKDRPILSSAINNANYLITLDKEFLNEKVSKFVEDKNLKITRPKEFIENHS
ncbi:MAG: putative toxin-antitoxin system toxin component, PIN family [Candidatus Magasanikbacteria bacterium]